MKLFTFISLLIIATSGLASSLVVSPEVSEITSADVAGIAEIDTLRVLPRGDKVLHIGEYAFWNLSSLKAVELPDGCRLSIGEGAFRGCDSLTKIYLPNGTIFEGQYIFSGCQALTDVHLPNDLDILPPHSFSYCSSLVSITLPGSIKRIGNNAFSECRRLSSIHIPDSVRELESYAFSECEAMKEARLPANGAMLGELIFSGCRNLERLYEPSREVPVFDCDSYIFEPDETGLYSECELIVPKVSLHLYQTSPGWSLFRKIISSPEP